MGDLRKANEARRLNGAKGGRPKGAISAETRRRMKAGELFRRRVCRNVNKLFNAQLALAQGGVVLFRIDGEGAHRRVTDPDEMCALLDLPEEERDQVLVVVAQKPDNHAIADMLDRTFGRPTQPLGPIDDSWRPLFQLPAGLTGPDVSPAREHGE